MAAPLYRESVSHACCCEFCTDVTSFRLWCGHALHLQRTTGSPLSFLYFGCHLKSPQGWQFERSSHKDGRSKETNPRGWEVERDQPTRMGKGRSQRDPNVVQVPLRRHSAQRTQCVRRVRRQRDGRVPSSGSSGSVPQSGLLRHVHFYLNRSPERLPRGTQGKFQATQVKVFSFLDSDELKVFRKACRLSRRNPAQRGEPDRR